MMLKSMFILLLSLSHIAFSYRILISCGVATRSHVKALLEISEHLTSLGHTAVFAIQENNIRFSKGYNVSNYILPGNTEFFNPVEFKSKGKEIDIDLNHKTFLSTFPELMTRFYDLNYSGLEQLLKEQHFDLFMCDFMGLACQDIAKKKEIPLVVGYQAMDYIMGIKSSYQTGHNKYGPLTTENLSFLERYKYQFLQPANDLRFFLQLDNNLKQIRKKYDVKEGILFEDNKYALNIINSFFGFETAAAIPPNYHVLGPLSTLPKDALDSNIGQFLDNHNKVLFVAFGSFAELGPKTVTTLLQSILQAIETNIIDGVIWGLGRTTSDKVPDVITIPNNDKQYDTNKLFNNKYSNVRLLKWAQQYQILNHKNTKLFLTHGGLESISEATLTSTPMLCLPILGDQPRNAKKIERMGIGSYLNPDDLSIDNIINKINNIIVDKDNEIELNLKKYKLLTSQPEKKIKHAAELVIKHVELSKLCRPNHPYNKEDVIPCELEHLIHKATLLNPIVLYNLDIYFINIILAFFIVYLIYKTTRLFIYSVYKSFTMSKLKVKIK